MKTEDLTPAIPFEQLVKEYQSPDTFLVEVDDVETAKKFFNSKTSAAWGNGPFGETGWTKIMSPSKRTAADRCTIFVCKTNILS